VQLSIAAKVGEGSIITENSVVKMNREVPAGVIVRGNPAVIIREVSQKDKESWTMGNHYYIEPATKYLSLGMSKTA